MAAGFGVGAAWAQTEVYCSLNEVKVERLSNATRVTLCADGTLQGEFRRAEYEPPDIDWSRPPQRRTFTFRLTNARTKLGGFVDIGAYPISHLTLTIPRDSREGVGLDVQAVLYKRGYLDFIWLGRDGFGMWVPDPPGVSIERDRDGRSVTLIATSDRYHEPQAERVMHEPTGGSLSVSADAEARVTVRALNARLGDVLQGIAGAAGLQIAVRGGANYRASMSVAGARPEQLLRAIARGYGLSVRSVGNVYYVTEGLPTEVDAYWAAPTAAFRLQHVTASEAVELLPDFLLRYVRADEGLNALVATGPPQLLDKLESDLRQVDRPVPQVELSAVIVEEVDEHALDAALAFLLWDCPYQ
jgi:hypothetical protein